jgi:hypothetical protein
MAIIKRPKFSSYKETALFAIIAIDINLLVVPCGKAVRISETPKNFYRIVLDLKFSQ